MRIGLVCPYSFECPGGVQRQSQEWANWLVDHGHSVSVLAPAVEDAHGFDPRVHRADAGPTLAYRWNGSVARVGMGPLVRRRVRAWLADANFDVVHLHEPMTPSVSWEVWRRWRGPTVATVHTARDDARLHRLAARLVPDRVARLSTVIAVSEQAATLARRYLPQEPQIIANALHIPEQAPHHTQTGRRSVLFCGRDEARKGLSVFLDCAPTLVDKGWEIDVVGAEVAAPAGVRVHGIVDDARRAELMQRADVLAAPQLHGESFGIVVAEAVAAGCRIAASDLPSFGWLADVGASVEYFPTGDPHGLAVAIERAYDLPPSDPHCLSRFTWEAVAPRILDIYTRVLQRSAPTE